MEKYVKIKQAIEKRRFSYAEKELLKLQKERGDSYDLLYLLGLVYHTKEDYAKTFEVAEKMLQLFPDDPTVLWLAGGAADNVEKHEYAIKLYNKILKKSDKTLAKHQNVMTEGRAKGIKLDVNVRIGECYYSLGEYVKAAGYFDKYVSLMNKDIRNSEYNKKQVQGYYIDCYIDFLYKEERYTKKNYSIAQKAYELAKDDPCVIMSFGGWANNMRQYDEAVRIYKRILAKSEKAILKFPEFDCSLEVFGLKLDACVRIANSYECANEYGKAIEYYNKYLEGKKGNIPSEYSKKIVQEYLRNCKAEMAK